MNAVPARADLSADLPAARPLPPHERGRAVAKSTHDVVKLFNGTLASVLGLVEAIRSYEPTVVRPTAESGAPCPPTSSRAGNGDSG